MIRQQRDDRIYLITQHDHALLSGKFADHVGNEAFACPSPLGPVIDGISMHDSGWPRHDAHPVLTREHRPPHVFETPVGVLEKLWTGSTRLAAEHHPYSGLLVSLHVLALSEFALSLSTVPKTRQDIFVLNKFQHAQLQQQEQLRRELALRTDLPLRFGLAAIGADPDEDLLSFNYNLLKAMDRISLDACCGGNLFTSIEGVYPQPGQMPITLEIKHGVDGELSLSPWPFNVDALRYEVPARVLENRSFNSNEDFQRTYAEAPSELYRIAITR